MSDFEQHPPVTTHRRREKKSREAITSKAAIDSLFDEPATADAAKTTRPPTEDAKNSAIATEDAETSANPNPTGFLFYEEVRDSYLKMNKTFPYATLQAGHQHLLGIKDLPENADPKSREHLQNLETAYDTALMGLNQVWNAGEKRYNERSPSLDDPHQTQRRVWSLSDENSAGSPLADDNLDKMPGHILYTEMLFLQHRKVMDLHLNNDIQLTKLLGVIRIANRNAITISLGDYYGALSSEFRTHKMLQKASDRKEYIFMGKGKISDIVDQYEDEQSPNFGHKKPMHNALDKAQKYLEPKYKDVNEIVGFLKGYADRNEAVHPVKEHFDRGDHAGLHRAMMKDIDSFPFIGDEPVDMDLKQEVEKVLLLVKNRFFDKWSDEPGGYIEPSRAMRDLRKEFVELMLKKDPQFLLNEQLKGQKVPASIQSTLNVEKADKTREASQSAADAADYLSSQDSRYKHALEVCDQHPSMTAVRLILVELMRDLKESRKTAQQFEEDVTKTNDRMTKAEALAKDRKTNLKELKVEMKELKVEFEEMKEKMQKTDAKFEEMKAEKQAEKQETERQIKELMAELKTLKSRVN